MISKAGGRLRRLRSAVAVVAVAGLGVLAAPQAAGAVNHDGWCDSGEYCMWQDAGFSNTAGFRDEFFSDSNYVGEYYLTNGVALNDNNSSGTNKDSGLYLKQYEHASNGGRYLLFYKYGAACGSLCYSYSNYGWMNDLGSSHLFTSST